MADEDELACQWWENLDAERRVKIFHWLTHNQHAGHAQPLPGQLALIEEGEKPA